MPQTSYYYRFAGIELASSVPLPELPRADAVTRLHYHIDIARARLFPDRSADWRHTWIGHDGAATLFGARTGDNYFLRFLGNAEARLSAEGAISLWYDPAASIESMRHVLLNQILPRRLAHDGKLMLHAGAINLDAHRCVVVVGDSGLGKSTLSAAFANDGCQVLTDDCVQLDCGGQNVCAIATYPGLRLLPDSLTALYGESPPATQPVAHYTPKRRLTQSMLLNAPTPPVSAIFVLQPPPVDAQIRIEPMASGPACMALVSNTFQLDPGDMARVRTLLAQAATIADRVPVYTLTYPRDYAMLFAIIGRIKELGADV